MVSFREDGAVEAIRLRYHERNNVILNKSCISLIVLYTRVCTIFTQKYKEIKNEKINFIQSGISIN